MEDKTYTLFTLQSVLTRIEGWSRLGQINLKPRWVSTLQSLIWIEKFQKLDTVKPLNLALCNACKLFKLQLFFPHC